MLHYEDNIKEHADIAQRELDRVARDARPVMLQIGINAKLRDGKYTAREVE